jgi:hypothetical protein
MSQVDDAIQRMLVRYFRQGGAVALNLANLRLQEDLEYLRIQWAISRQISELADYLLENRHEAQASLSMVVRDESSIIRGRLLPARTILRRRMTGDYSLTSYLEPQRNFSDGPNYVLGWVLRMADYVVQRHLELIAGTDEYNDRAHYIRRRLTSIRHLAGIGQVISTVNLRTRPSIKSVIQCGKARRLLYRKAFAAYQALKSVEAGDVEASTQLLNGSLIGPLTDWQKFELLLALRLAEALADQLAHELVLHPIQQGAARPIASFGPYDLYWQNQTPYRRNPELEPSEMLTNEILFSYNFQAGWDRPDVVICNRETRSAIAIGEAKFSTNGSDAWRDSFREAVSQLVRYSRLYVHKYPQKETLRRSVLAVSNLPNSISEMPTPDDSPAAVNLADLLEGRLDRWAQRVISSLPSS